jgi:hypothetical protein
VGVSENGQSSAALYWKQAPSERPLGGSLRVAQPSKTTQYGYAFDCYTKGD